MSIIEKINLYAKTRSNVVACYNYSHDQVVQSLTYKELVDFSDKLGFYLQKTLGDNKNPIVVYGHKNPYMLVCFLACVKSGRAYVPVDISVPKERVKDIVDATNTPLVLCTESTELLFDNVIHLDEIKDIINVTDKKITSDYYVKAEDIFYIIFTSGSTGNPKGVRITEQCLINFIRWAVTLGEKNFADKQVTIINQAPFSFDLSVMDLYMSLYLGGTLWCLEKSAQSNYGVMYESLKKSNANIMVSTPSFANLCLSGDVFDKNLMPKMELFLFCGETLPNSTAKQLLDRFPKANVINTYGPTESTVAVTEIDVTHEILKGYNPLPVGEVKPGTHIFIQDESGNLLPEGDKGEIVIVGDTVSPGYLNAPNISFSKKKVGKKLYRSYRTGDKGYIKDGYIFYCGRMDSQIKLHGYRIEIEDIENNLQKLPIIKNAAVIPVENSGAIDYLVAFVVVDFEVESSLKASVVIKKGLQRFLPQYMVPKKFVFKDALPITDRGKIDRRKLKEEVA
ncbi:MAG: D-alanine--poly(phosphoribitol) ligase subunit DltA [Clostridia bacterium]|nr:D-alanine--poly(phosphoribitol) ligase subunit DltA [Clostridia bacterium]